ncbi:MAG: thiolase family protein [Oligoflexia bacterium]|nr:thiolase family protein [Oligoflexia bacterium]
MSVYIVSAKRTPIGRFKGALSSLSATELGSVAVKALLKEQEIDSKQIDECIVGQVLTAGSGQAPARQTALGAGLDSSTACVTVNKVCGSGLKAVQMACDSIQLGRSHLVIAGGQENMSQAPHLLPKARFGAPHLGDWPLIDSLLTDGLINPYDKKHMGSIGEICAQKYNFSKEEQDAFAKTSFEKTLRAQEKNWFKEEIAPVLLESKRGEPIKIDRDEQPSQKDYERIDRARPIFEKEGTISAGNASKINDGAAFLLLASEKAVKEHNLEPMACILGQNAFAQDPHWFTTAPIHSIHKLIQQSQLKLEEMDLFEVNEAFSAVALAIAKEVPISQEKLNIHGGAVALGHPIGASGARILTTLIHALKTHQKRKGIASICLGGGEACSLAVESLY